MILFIECDDFPRGPASVYDNVGIFFRIEPDLIILLYIGIITAIYSVYLNRKDTKVTNYIIVPRAPTEMFFFFFKSTFTGNIFRDSLSERVFDPSSRVVYSFETVIYCPNSPRHEHARDPTSDAHIHSCIGRIL